MHHIRITKYQIRQAIKIVSLKVRNIDNAFREYFLYEKSRFAIRIIISN